MRSIIALDPSIITKIAAGEVIERPAFAVKELIENAIDANATTIEIHIQGSCLKHISVVDNGHGMDKEDLLMCYLSHTTSKISQEEDLYAIKTLGFRGEALAAIAAISNMTIKSRTKQNAVGTQVTLREGVVEKVQPVGTIQGTVVTVENLFHTIPARKKFLKSETTEFRNVTSVVTQFALSYPHIHFLLTNNNKEVVTFPKKESSIGRIKTIMGENFFEQAVPLSVVEGYVTIQGFIGKPQVAAKNNQKQYIFVNKRQISDRMISLAVKEAYSTLLPASYTPIFILHISLPYELVDVNVHPRKESVTFSQPDSVFSVIKNAVYATLQEHNLIFNLAKYKQETSANIAETTSTTGVVLKEKVLPWNSDIVGNDEKTQEILQINNTYFGISTKDGLLLIDQHAAHERILYDKLHKAFVAEKEKKQQYELPSPLIVSLTVSDMQLYEQYKDVVVSIGFEIDTFQGNQIVIRKVPRVFKGRNIENIIRELLVDIATYGDIQSLDVRSQRMLAYIACKSAVKAGDVLEKTQCRKIISELSRADIPFTCPHGRPTSITLTTKELHKWFKRNN